MILDTNKKIIIFLNPKTGTTTLCHLYKDFELLINDHNHCTFNTFRKVYSDIPNDLSEYTFFCFYRDPIERFLSSFISFTKLVVKQEISILDFIKDLNDDVSITMKKQIEWLDHKDLVLLDYRNYSNEIRKLGITAEHIPVTNTSKRLKLLFPTHEERHTIREYYMDDYKFFETKNILF
jgi:hypothetical protein